MQVLGVNVLTTKPKEKRRNRSRGRVKGYTSPWKQGRRDRGRGPTKIEFFEGV